MSHNVIYKVNCSNADNIIRHLFAVDGDYAIRLSDRIDINEYAYKLFEKSERIEAWDNDVLVGLVAYYNNSTTNSVYVSNVSVIKEYRTCGIASVLLTDLKNIVVKKRIAKIVLEADVSLMNFYVKNDFTIGKSLTDSSYEMEYYRTDNDIMVSICCLVYNHEPYLRQCFDGFIMQKTTFPIEILVHDDASTDHSADIIREYTAKYPDLFKPIYQTENQYSKGVSVSATYQIPRVKGKYIAFCEGDDYWTDPLKLQKQVDFLEGHEEYVLCAHNSITLEHDTGRMGCFNKWFENHVFTFEDVIKKDWFLPTQSLLYRTEVLNRNKIDKRFYNGDYFLQLCLTKDGGLIYYSNECMAVYRIGTGISRTVTGHENNLRLIELLEFMRASSSTEYDSAFEERVNRLRSQNESLEKIEQSKLNSRKFWYRIRYRFLYVFVKLLSFKNPRVMFYKDYWN